MYYASALVRSSLVSPQVASVRRVVIPDELKNVSDETPAPTMCNLHVRNAGGLRLPG